MVEEVKEEIKDEVSEDTTPEKLAESLFDKDSKDKEESKEEVKDDDQKEVVAEENNDDANPAEEQEETTEETKPAELELSLSKDSPLDDGYIDAVKEHAKEKGLDQEAAQELLSHKEDAVKDYILDVEHKNDSKAEEGLKDLKAKYGEKFTEAQELALKPYKDPRFVGESDEQQRIVDFVLKTRLADDPVFFEWSRKIGLAMSDDTYLKANTPVKAKKTAEQLFYGAETANKE